MVFTTDCRNVDFSLYWRRSGLQHTAQGPVGLWRTVSEGQSQQECLPAPGTPSKTARRVQRGKETFKVSQGEDEGSGLVLRGIWPVWGDRCFCVDERGERTLALLSLISPQRRWTGRCVERPNCHAATLSSTVLSHDVLSWPLHLLITPPSPGSSWVAQTHLISRTSLFTSSFAVAHLSDVDEPKHFLICRFSSTSSPIILFAQYCKYHKNSMRYPRVSIPLYGSSITFHYLRELVQHHIKHHYGSFDKFLIPLFFVFCIFSPLNLQFQVSGGFICFCIICSPRNKGCP